jgi:homotetrameric cytidine deaminase
MAFSPRELLHEAKRALAKSYAPYSCFNVGAAILTKEDKIITAANVEFSVSAIGMCAERLALSECRMRKLTPAYIAICTHYENVYRVETTPCGLCRQAMVEFDKFKIVTPRRTFSVKELLPKAYQGRKARV